MSTNELPSLINAEGNVLSTPSPPSREHEAHDVQPPAGKMTASAGFSSSQTTSTVDLPQAPLQVHLHCYPPTRIINTPSDNTFQNVNDGNIFHSPALADNRGVCPQVYIFCPGSDHTPNSKQPLDILANAILSADMSPDATNTGEILQALRGNDAAATGGVFRSVLEHHLH
jgi:hypothetical protein